ncbi:hypothetical protein [Haliangium sp.]|uniref:hypothetical protein n=1 Tax=Haliangium sp. TaxID=2663208 RepID=UPI003D14AE4B
MHALTSTHQPCSWPASRPGLAGAAAMLAAVAFGAGCGDEGGECERNIDCNQDGKQNGECAWNTKTCVYPELTFEAEGIAPSGSVLSLETDSTGRLLLPLAVVDVPYQVSLTVAGGDGLYTWSHLAGDLVAGLSLGSDGVLSGTPSEAAGACVTFQVLSAEYEPTQEYCLNVSDRIANRMLPEQLTLPAGTLGQPYLDPATGNPLELRMGGGTTGPYRIFLHSGDLPPGLGVEYVPGIDDAIGTLSGTPGEAGTWSFTIRGEDVMFEHFQLEDPELQNVIERTYTLTIEAGAAR